MRKSLPFARGRTDWQSVLRANGTDCQSVLQKLGNTSQRFGEAPMKRLLLCLLLIPSILLGLVASSSAAEPASPRKTYGKIELLRDPWGVPHVFSESDAGAMYGLGCAVAEDRGFQMYYS